MPDPVFEALRAAASDLAAEGANCALVGGLAVSARAEVRFTRDVDLAVAVSDDEEAELLVASLRTRGYAPLATVEHDFQERLATVRLGSLLGIKIDLLFASSGIENETVQRATELELPFVGRVAVARAEELLAMKLLSMDERRLQDQIDARRLITRNPLLDMDAVAANIDLITSRGFNRRQDLRSKLSELLAAL